MVQTRYIGTLPFKQKEVRMEDTFLLQYLKNHTMKKFYPVILIVGRQRSGKTAMALWLAEQVCEFRGQKFNIDTDMFFSIEDMANRYKDAKNKVLILDEAGISLNVFEGNSLPQRVFMKIMDSQAYLGNVLVICLPHASDIGRHHRNHVNLILEMRGRGCYTLYHVSKRYRDLSMKPPFIEEFETVYGIPLPTKETWEKYLLVGQQKFKQEILDTQIELLEEKKALKAARLSSNKLAEVLIEMKGSKPRQDDDIA